MVNHTIDDFEDKTFAPGVEELFARDRKNKNIENYTKSQPGLLCSACLIGCIFVMLLYFLLPVSCISSYSVAGNFYLPDDYILKLTGLSEKSRLYLSLPKLLEKKLEDEPMIASAKVTWQRGNRIAVEVTEKQPFAYDYSSETPTVWYTDGTKAELNSAYLDLIAYIPYLSGFTDADTAARLTYAFSSVNRDIIDEIAEISQYSVSYDQQMVKILMRDGTYFVSSLHCVPLLNHYDEVAAKMKNRSNCLIADDTANVIVEKACPWNEAVAVKEYWTDDAGNRIKNVYGDEVVRQYYTLADGTQAVDGAGNPIPIPINEDGLEVIDNEFQSHYEAGYYVTGKLVLPGQ